MNFTENIPYKLGSTFDENNIDLELKKSSNYGAELYRSYRYSEIYLFGKALEAVCYLFFFKRKLSTIEYRIPMSNYDFFKEAINNELPIGIQLEQDPNIEETRPYIYHNGIAISLVKLNEEFFLYRLSDYPSLPRICRE